MKECAVLSIFLITSTITALIIILAAALKAAFLGSLTAHIQNWPSYGFVLFFIKSWTFCADNPYQNRHWMSLQGRANLNVLNVIDQQQCEMCLCFCFSLFLFLCLWCPCLSVSVCMFEITCVLCVCGCLSVFVGSVSVLWVCGWFGCVSVHVHVHVCVVCGVASYSCAFLCVFACEEYIHVRMCGKGETLQIKTELKKEKKTSINEMCSMLIKCAPQIQHCHHLQTKSRQG